MDKNSWPQNPLVSLEAGFVCILSAMRFTENCIDWLVSEWIQPKSL